jgi:hypothetical protein
MWQSRRHDVERSIAWVPPSAQFETSSHLAHLK